MRQNVLIRSLYVAIAFTITAGAVGQTQKVDSETLKKRPAPKTAEALQQEIRIIDKCAFNVDVDGVDLIQGDHLRIPISVETATSGTVILRGDMKKSARNITTRIAEPKFATDGNSSYATFLDVHTDATSSPGVHHYTLTWSFNPAKSKGRQTLSNAMSKDCPSVKTSKTVTIRVKTPALTERREIMEVQDRLTRSQSRRYLTTSYLTRFQGNSGDTRLANIEGFDGHPDAVIDSLASAQQCGEGLARA